MSADDWFVAALRARRAADQAQVERLGFPTSSAPRQAGDHSGRVDLAPGARRSPPLPPDLDQWIRDEADRVRGRRGL